MSQSRAQRAYDKRRYKKAREYKNKKYEPTNECTTKFTARESSNSNIADHELTKKYSVTYHSAHRMGLRMLDKENLTNTELNMCAVMLAKELGDLINVDGKHTIYNDYTAVVKNKIVVTILNKKERK